MIRSDAPALLFIEPQGSPTEEAVDDAYTQAVVAALFSSEAGIWSGGVFIPGSGWRGFHVCKCGTQGTGNDYQLPGGMITNALAAHYLSYHRSEVPESELEKVRQLPTFTG